VYHFLFTFNFQPMKNSCSYTHFIMKRTMHLTAERSNSQSNLLAGIAPVFSGRKTRPTFSRVLLSLTFLLLFLAAGGLQAQIKLWGMTSDGGEFDAGTIINLNTDGSDFNTFSFYKVVGAQPRGDLLEASNGKFYGMTPDGGDHFDGVIFEYDPVGDTYLDLHHFSYSTSGATPRGSLAESGGKFYGMTFEGGSYGFGVLFEFNPVGNVFTVVRHFDTSPDGGFSYCSLIASGGKLYGMNTSGGANADGTLFEFNPVGNVFTVLRHFTRATDGRRPEGRLLESGGKFYGLNSDGGSSDDGTLFEFNPAGNVFTVLKHFDSSPDGGSPFGSLVETGGKFYGMTNQHGSNSSGTLFEFNPAGNVFTVLKHFNGPTDGEHPFGSLLASGGKFYGMTNLGGSNSDGTLFEFNPAGNMFTVLKHFESAPDGRNPFGSLMASGGKFYGMTNQGGTENDGTLFEFNPAGNVFTVLKHFDSSPDGGSPDGSLLESGSKFYGMTDGGGSNDDGTLFELNPVGNVLTVLRHFESSTDGKGPDGSLIESGGKFYGMASLGGSNDYGTLFEFNPVGNVFTVLKNFDYFTDGAYPGGSLLESGGKFYGMTNQGGSNGYGTLFEYNPVGNVFTVLKNFSGSDGANPYGDLLESGGKFYGMTPFGGSGGYGVLFEFNPAGNVLTVLKHFGGTDGTYPFGSVIASSGKFYGMTNSGGSNDYGTLFEFNPAGNVFTVLKHFDYSADGGYANGSLIATGGKFYGMISAGGSNDKGTLFEFNPAGNVFTVLRHFDGADGANPQYGHLIAVGTAEAPDYTITTTGNAIVITDDSGNGETLDVSQSGSNIRFVVTPDTRTYSINGGAVTAFSTPADVALAGATSIEINTAAGADTINIGAFTANLPNLTVNGGTGNDAVNFNGNITFAANANLDVDLQNDNATPGTDQVEVATNANLLLSGTGKATVKVSRNVVVNSGGSIETTDGDLIVEANQQVTPTTGTFVGVDVNAGELKVSGSGILRVKGKGGTIDGSQHGVVVQAAGKIEGGTGGPVEVEGRGGEATNFNHYGIYINGTDSRITSSGGDVSVKGTGGFGVFGYGVYVLGGSRISAGGAGMVNVEGKGGRSWGDFHYGVYVSGTGSQIISDGGDVSVKGNGGDNGEKNYGVFMSDGGQISAGDAGIVTVEGQGGTISTGFNNHGVYLDGTDSRITSGGGDVLVKGTSGVGSSSSSNHYGVGVFNGSRISAGGTGKVTVEGWGGLSASGLNIGVLIGGTNSRITSGSGDVSVKGTGGGNGNGSNHYGVWMHSGGEITAGGTGKVTVEGQGGLSTINLNIGVRIEGANTRITSGGGGDVLVKGNGGGSGGSFNNYGVDVISGGEISAGGMGKVTVEGKGGAASQLNHGVEVLGAASRITSSGGDVMVKGTGAGNGFVNYGVNVSQGGEISAGGTGKVTVEGQGSISSTDGQARGVYLDGSNSRITSVGGDVSVKGFGGGLGNSGANQGVCVFSGGQISAGGGTSKVQVEGQGGASTGNSNYGVYVNGTNSRITSDGGDLHITGIEGGGPSRTGIVNESFAAITTAVNGGNIALIANSMRIQSAVSANGSATTTIRPYTNGVQINLGSATDPIGGPLSLSDTEFDFVTAGMLLIGDANSGTITLSADITRPASTNVELHSNGDVTFSGGGINTGGGTLLLNPGTSPAAVKPAFQGTDATASTVSFASDLSIVINGATPGNGAGSTYTQLTVAGAVNLTGVDLVLSGSHTPIAGQTFTIVDNDGADAITGIFTGLAEGATIVNFLNNGLNATITYMGGTDNNDVVLEAVCPTITFSATPINTCLGFSTGQIAITGETGGISPYLYSINNGADYQSGATFTGLAANTYQVKIKDGNNCESGAQSVVVGNFPLPNAGTINGAFTVCIGSDTDLNSNGEPGGVWSSNANGTATVDNTGLVTGVTPGITTITYTVTDGNGCVSGTSVVVTVNAQPTPANAGPDQTGASTCGQTQVILAANAPTIGTGQWSVQSGTGGSFGNAASPSSVFSGMAGNTYTLRWTISNVPCTASTDDVVVAFNQNPTVTCPANLTVNISDPAFTVMGESPAGGTYSGPGISSGMFNPATAGAGTHTITYSYTNAAGCSGSCTCTITVDIEISGTVIWEHDDVTGVGNASVALTGDQTGSATTPAAGTYSLTATSGSNFTVTPTKNINKLNGVTAADVTAIQQHVANNVPITDAYKQVAADVNKSNSISTLDASIINQSLLGNPAALAQFKTSWRFTPTSHTMNNPPWGFPENRTYTNINTNQTNQNFYGIKTGDIVTTFANPANFGAGNPLVLNVQDQVLGEQKEIAVEFKADQLDYLAAFQFALKFDVEKLELAEITPLAGLPLAAENFGTYNLAEGEIRAVWSQATSVFLEEAVPVFLLKFKVLQGGGKLSEALQLDESALPALSYNQSLAESKVELKFSEATGTNAPTAAGLQLFQNRPNPFDGTTTISFVLPENCEAQLRIFDVSGRMLAERKAQYPAGKNEEVFDLGSASGVLYYELTTPFGVLAKKMVAH
jgi:uncharacterized repeat protein (TIGR03803 family)